MIDEDKLDFSRSNVSTGPCDLQHSVQETPDESSVYPENRNQEANYTEWLQDLEFCNVEFDNPKNFQEAMAAADSAEWKEAMDCEIKILQERNVYEEVRRPRNETVLGNKWVYVRKKDQRQRVVRHRARLVAQGFNQRPGIDFEDIYSPVVNFILIRLLMYVLVLLAGWTDRHLDVKSAYLYGNLDKPIYMEPPKGYTSRPEYVWKVNKSLYGLHQSGRCWFQKLDSDLIKAGFTRLKSCQCVYRWKWDSIILVYVDDILVLSKNDAIMEETIKRLQSLFDIKNLGPVRLFLGIDITRVKEGIEMSQKTYIDKLRRRLEHIPYKKTYEPMKCGLHLEAKLHSYETSTDDQDVLDVPYRALIGSMLFIARHTRPDILYAVTHLARYCNAYNVETWNCLVHLWNYVITTKQRRILLQENVTPQLLAYSDASWASDALTRKSMSGYIILVGQTPIVWRCVKQNLVALSTMESEIIASTELVKEIIWLDRILKECATVVPTVQGAMNVYLDNQAAIHCIKNRVDNNKSKYIDLRLQFVRDKYQSGLFHLQFVSTKQNVADMLTKALTKDRLEKLTCYLD